MKDQIVHTSWLASIRTMLLATALAFAIPGFCAEDKFELVPAEAHECKTGGSQQEGLPATPANLTKTPKTTADTSKFTKEHMLDIKKFNISSDGTNPAETSKGISIINAKMKTRDNIELACDVYLPPDYEQRYPVIVSFSPYNSTGARSSGGLSWVQRGFAYVGADCRGRFKSGGTFTPWVNEVADAYDLLDWISRQKWCNGNIGMVGGSYVGFTQLAAAVSRHPALKAAAPSAIQSDIYSIYYTGGAQVLAFMAPWHIGMTHRGSVKTPPPNWLEILRKTPYSKLDEYADMPCPSWKETVSHDHRDAYWEEKSFDGRLRDTQVGLFLQNSWYDQLGAKTFSLFNEIVGSPDFSTSTNKKYTRLRVGPWGHGVNTKEGELDYGADSVVTEDAEINFISSILHGEKADMTDTQTRLQIFVMGENKWRFENEWPLERTQWTAFYLGSVGNANTLNGDGYLSRNQMEIAKGFSDSFISKHEDPVPTCGGRVVGNGGQRNQMEIEKRKDVLVYTLPQLTKDMEVTGPVSMKLFASSSTPDADFAVKLVDVYPDGRPFNVCDGILRASFRRGLDKKSELMKPGIVYELDIDVDVTSYLFKPGHWLRVEIAGSNFPHYSRNPHAGAKADTDAAAQEAVQTIYHSPEYPSRIILPVIPHDY
jgi:putative CocE/NonD family hydrolase